MRRFLVPLLIFLGGSALTHQVARLAEKRENTRIFSMVASEFDAREDAIAWEIARNLETVYSVCDFYGASVFVERDEFRTFAAGALGRRESIQALAWIPRVPRSERPRFEEAARRDGLIGFAITDLHPQDARPEYFPIYYVEPRAGNEHALGFDVSTRPITADALRRARESGSMALSSSLHPITDTAPPVFLAVLPVFRNGAPARTPEERRENLEGFVIGIYPVERIVRSALRPFEGHSIIRILHRITDQAAQEEGDPLYESEGFAEALRAEAEGATLASFDHPPIRVADAVWRIESVLAPDGFSSENSSPSAWVWTAGLLLSLILAVYAFHLARRNEEIRRGAEALRERTQDLATYHDLVTHDVSNFSHAISGLTELLLGESVGPPTPKQKEWLMRLRRQVLEMGRLAENARIYTCIREGLPHPPAPERPLSELFRNALQSVRDIYFDRPFETAVEGPEDLVVTGVPFLESIVSNLVDNAVRHGPRDGSARVEIRFGRAEGSVFVAVRGGTPPDAEFIARLFERGSRGDASKGAGLGLSLIRTIVERAGGTARAGVAPSPRGEVFEILLTFPCSERPPRG